MRATHRIASVRVVPVAFPDPPLLNAVGAHEPWALRSVIVLRTSEGITGLGESYGQAPHLLALEEAARRLVGLEVHDLVALRRIARDVAAQAGPGRVHFDARGSAEWAARIVSAFEVAMLDAQARAAGLPVHALLGGRVRERVPVAGYLFFKWAAHPGAEPDAFGEALDEEGLVAQARMLVERYGFRSLKVKGGVLAPERELDALAALRAAFPDAPLRLDPNTAWTVPTAIRVARAAEGLVEYLEDPTAGIEGMAAVARASAVPLATNMCVTETAHLPEALAQGAVDIILADHHYWGGLTGSAELAAVCRIWSRGVSMHSNSHLGVSLAAMTHLAAATENLDYAIDTHTPWQDGVDVVVDPLEIRDGDVVVPDAPGLGVRLDEEKLAVLHENHRRHAGRRRDDAGYRRAIEPSFDPRLPRW